MSNRRKTLVVFDGDEVREMREAIPSLRRRGRSISKVELSEFLDVNVRTLFRYESHGAPMSVKYMYQGVRQHIEDILTGIERDIVAEGDRLKDKIEHVTALRDALMTKVGLPK